jgi:hypothetical protein
VVEAAAAPVPAGEPLPVGRWARLRRRPFATAAGVSILCRLVTVAAVVVADVWTHKGLGHTLGGWDGAWFLRAVDHGYPAHLPRTDGHVAANPVAFFPFFPLVVRVLHDVTRIDPLGLALVVSGATGVTATVAVGVLTREFAGPEAAGRAALLFAVFPGTFVFSLAYAEGIVVTCVALGLLALLRRRWLAAGLLGLVTTASSPVSLAFVLSCAWCALVAVRRDRDWRALAAPVLAPVGFVLWMAYLWAHTGTLDAWRLTERGGWKSYPSLRYPLHLVWETLRSPVAPVFTDRMLLLCSAATVVAAVLAVRQRQPAPVLWYGLTAALLAACSAPVGLRPRFMMLAFPLVIAVATRVRGRAFSWLVVGSAVLLAGATAMTLTWSGVFP